MTLLESSEPGKNVETEFWRKVQNSTFESTEIHLNVRSDQPIWFTVWYRRKWSKTRFFQGNNTKHVLRPGFFFEFGFSAVDYVFSSNSAAIWALAYGPSPFFTRKWLNFSFWANFEKPDFLTILDVSYGPKQWRYTAFDFEFGFSAVDYPYTWILSPMLGDLYGFPEAQKVRFSAFKVGTQENRQSLRCPSRTYPNIRDNDLTAFNSWKAIKISRGIVI